MIYSIIRLVLVAFLAAFLTGSLSAQDSDTLLTARVIEVQSGKTNEFVDLQRQFTEARKKAGSPGRWIWQEVRGNSSTFHIITKSENFAELDESTESPLGDAGWATWISRIGPTIKNREVVTVRLRPELAIPPKNGYEPNLLLLTQRTIGSGRTNEYRVWLKEKLHPALKKAGVTGWSVGKTIYGANTRVWTSAQHFASWSELDNSNPFSNLSDKEREALFEGSAGRVIGVKNTLLRYRADLSHDDPE